MVVKIFSLFNTHVGWKSPQHMPVSESPEGAMTLRERNKNCEDSVLGLIKYQQIKTKNTDASG